ncbi:PA domain-containing protein [Portibacter marinus]|uniref:PA domain-containing protein n=1 Tax=Portibacter marinus TaxID=2898660 RepID=UPI001F3D361F|nr:PA domain-containing protein [Portibacter marinus]
MNLIKTGPRAAGMFFLSLTFLLIFLVFSCEKESIETLNLEHDVMVSQDLDRNSGQLPKVDICHIDDEGGSRIINVNGNAWPDHELHGDAIDQDGDGLFDRENDCSITDCNDEDPVNLSGKYCGLVYGYFNGEYIGNLGYVITVEEGGCAITVEAGYCFEGIEWTLTEANGNVYTYMESDPCAIDGCMITLVNNGNDVHVSFDCGELFPPGFEIEGTFKRYEGETNFQEYLLLVDQDGDNWYDVADNAFSSCQPEGYTSLADLGNFQIGDCDDMDPTVNPGANEACDLIDKNCDNIANYPIGLVNGVEGTGATFGPSNAAITAPWTNVEPTTACFFLEPEENPIVNDLSGKIAVIDRGLCFFDKKVKFAEEKGAVAAIICNEFDELEVMRASGVIEEPTIPSIFVSSSHCQLIRSNPDGLLNFEVICGLELQSNLARSVNQPESLHSLEDNVLSRNLKKQITGSSKFELLYNRQKTNQEKKVIFYNGRNDTSSSLSNAKALLE